MEVFGGVLGWVEVFGGVLGWVEVFGARWGCFGLRGAVLGSFPSVTLTLPGGMRRVEKCPKMSSFVQVAIGGPS